MLSEVNEAVIQVAHNVDVSWGPLFLNYDVDNSRLNWAISSFAEGEKK